MQRDAHKRARMNAPAEVTPGERYVRACVDARGTDTADLPALYALLLREVPPRIQLGSQVQDARNVQEADQWYRMLYGEPTLERVCAILSREYYATRPEALPARDYFGARTPQDVLVRTLGYLPVPNAAVPQVSRRFQRAYAQRTRDADSLAALLLAVLRRAPVMQRGAPLWWLVVPQPHGTLLDLLEVGIEPRGGGAAYRLTPRVLSEGGALQQFFARSALRASPGQSIQALAEPTARSVLAALVELPDARVAPNADLAALLRDSSLQLGPSLDALLAPARALNITRWRAALESEPQLRAQVRAL